MYFRLAQKSPMYKWVTSPSVWSTAILKRSSYHRYAELESSWPDEEWCRLLVHHSQHLFQWSCCNFIQGDGAIGLSPRERLRSLLQAANSHGYHSLDDLYKTILSKLFTSDKTQECFRTLMALVLALNEPMSLDSHSALLDRDLDIRAVIKPLLDGVVDEQKPICPFHTSFRDFLQDADRNSTLHVLINFLDIIIKTKHPPITPCLSCIESPFDFPSSAGSSLLVVESPNRKLYEGRKMYVDGLMMLSPFLSRLCCTWNHTI